MLYCSLKATLQLFHTVKVIARGELKAKVNLKVQLPQLQLLSATGGSFEKVAGEFLYAKGKKLR